MKPQFIQVLHNKKTEPIITVHIQGKKSSSFLDLTKKEAAVLLRDLVIELASRDSDK